MHRLCKICWGSGCISQTVICCYFLYSTQTHTHTSHKYLTVAF